MGSFKLLQKYEEVVIFRRGNHELKSYTELPRVRAKVLQRKQLQKIVSKRSREASPDGHMHLKANNVRMTSTENEPLSTKSPLKRYGFSSDGSPLSSKIFNKS